MTETKVLDHGYVKFIESWGSDEQIIASARMSTDGAFRGWERESAWICPQCGYMVLNNADPKKDVRFDCPNGHGGLNFDPSKSHPGDVRLLSHLWNHKHSTPFEFAGMTIEVQAPIMVFREWHRHRTQSYSEISARYTPLPNVNYVPSVDRCMIVNGANKQANAVTGADVLTHESVLQWLESLEALYVSAQQVYQDGLKRGIPKEVARLPVPVGRYSQMRASTDLRNWLGFTTLRCHETAQWEIRQFANEVAKIIELKFPRTYTLWSAAK